MAKVYNIMYMLLRLQTFNKNVNSLYKFVLIGFKDERRD